MSGKFIRRLFRRSEKVVLYCICTLAFVGTGFLTTALAQQAYPDIIAVSVTGSTQGGPGYPITVTLTVGNQGSIDTGDFQAGLYLSTDATITTGDILLGTVDVCNLRPGATLTEPVTLTVPSSVANGTYYLGMIADPAGNVMDSNETNNSIAGNQITISNLPNVVITSLSGSPTAFTGGNITFSVTVVNNGFSTAYDTRLDIWLKSTPQVPQCAAWPYICSPFYQFVGTLAPGQPVTFTVQGGLGMQTTPGTYYGVAGVYYKYSAQPGGNYGNNSLVGNQTVIIGPDTTITAVSGPQTGYIGESIPVSNTVAQAGVVCDTVDGGYCAQASITVRLCLFQADRTTISSCLAARDAGALGADASSTDITAVTIPAGVAPGTYYIGAVSEAWVYDIAYDQSWIVPETNMSNNTLVSTNPITILSQ